MAKKNGPGRPPSQYQMENSKFDADDFFLYAPKNTILKEEINRFLELCDNMVMQLNLEEVSENDLNAIALYNRLQIYTDMIFTKLAEMEATDTTLVRQLTEFNKEKEKHLENLKIRRQDRVTNDDLRGGTTITQLALEHDKNPDTRINKQKDITKELQEFTKEHPSIDPLVFTGRKSPDNKPVDESGESKET